MLTRFTFTNCTLDPTAARLGPRSNNGVTIEKDDKGLWCAADEALAIDEKNDDLTLTIGLIRGALRLSESENMRDASVIEAIREYLGMDNDREEDAARAARIAHDCNAHEANLETVKALTWALEDCAESLFSVDRDHPDTPGYQARAHTAKKARAAIAKAKGETT